MTGVKPDDENSADRGAAGPLASFFPSFETIGRALEAGQIGVWSWNIPADRVTWSSNLEAIHGLPPGSFNGTSEFFQNDIHPNDRATVRAAIDEALRTGRPYSIRYRLPEPRRGEERWIQAMGAVFYKDKAPVEMLGICQDVTDEINLERELRQRARQQAAVAGLGERALVESNLQTLLNDAVRTIADTLSLELVEILELMPSYTEVVLRAGVGWRDGVIGSVHWPSEPGSKAAYTLASSGPVIIEDTSTESRFTVSDVLRQHGAVSGVSLTIRGHDGRAYGVLGAYATSQRHFGAQDVSFLAAVANIVASAIQRLQLDQRHELMIRELRHRSGNLFSQLLALFSQTARNSRSVAELVTKYEARVLALANAHRLISEGGWKTISLNELLRVLLAPYIDRISFGGPDVLLEPDPTFGLTTALHELVANASKHGSLSRPEGRIDLTWEMMRTQRGLTLRLDWVERLGPPPKRVRRAGFGSKLIGLVIERQLNGEVQRKFRPQGLAARLLVPLTHERWPRNDPVPATHQNAGA
jgi:PAS domain S-box-containing protein